MANAARFVCRIAWFKNQNKVLDLSGGVRTAGTPIQLWDDLNNDHQQWLFDPADNGYYCIALAADPSKVLDLPNGNGANGVDYWIWDRQANNPNQLYTLYFLNGVYAIEPKSAAGRVLDLRGASTANGNRIQSYEYLGNDNQKWVLRFTQSSAASGLSGGSQFVLSMCPDSKPGTPRNIVDAACRIANGLTGGPAGIIKMIQDAVASDSIELDPGERGASDVWKDVSTFGEEPKGDDHGGDDHGGDDHEENGHEGEDTGSGGGHEDNLIGSPGLPFKFRPPKPVASGDASSGAPGGHPASPEADSTSGASKPSLDGPPSSTIVSVDLKVDVAEIVREVGIAIRDILSAVQERGRGNSQRAD